MKNQTYESNRLWEEEISRQRLKNLLSQGYPFGEPYPEGNPAPTPQSLMGPAWVPGQMRGPCGTPMVASHYVNGMVVYHQLPFGAPIQGQFGPSPGPFYPSAQPFMVPFGFQPAMDYPPSTRMVNPSYPGPNSGSTYNPGTFGANSGPDLSRCRIATTTTTTTTTTSSAFRGTISTPTRRF